MYLAPVLKRNIESCQTHFKHDTVQYNIYDIPCMAFMQQYIIYVFTHHAEYDEVSEKTPCARNGYLLALQQTLRLVEDGLLHGGPPCCSFIWINRGTSGRSSENPLGDTDQPSVQKGNQIFGLHFICNVSRLIVSQIIMMSPHHSAFDTS